MTSGPDPKTFRPRLVPRADSPTPRVVIHGRKSYLFNDLYASLMQATWPQLVVTLRT